MIRIAGAAALAALVVLGSDVASATGQTTGDPGGAGVVSGQTAATPSSSAAVPEPRTYRMDAYRAPVPDTLDGATVLSTAEAEKLWRAGEAVFIDVLPKPPTPKLPKGTVFRLPPRDDIPGSVWLPDVGYGSLSEEMAGYFKDNLVAATGGDRSRAIVFYCLADCWMSWNAARRAVEWGYTAVHWYPEGTDGWTFEGLPTETARPRPRPGLSE